MSRLDDLIKEYCPNGVDYFPLGEVCNISKGVQFNKTDMQDEGTFPVINGGINPSGFIEQYNQTENTITISQGGASAGYVNWITTKFWAGAHCYVVKPKDLVLNRYVFHFLKLQEKKLQECQYGAGIPALGKGTVSNLQLPIPPLPIQEEIVRILDTFTELTAELTEELLRELAVRESQFEYFKDKVLSFDERVERIPMGDLFEFRNGLSKGKEFFGRGVPFIRYTDVYNNSSLKRENITALVECTDKEKNNLRVNRGDVLFTRTSETVEDVGRASVMLDDIEECVFNGFTIKASPKTSKLLPEYCALCFSTSTFRTFVANRCTFTTRASLTGKAISEYVLSVPNKEIQKKISTIFNKYEANWNNLSESLKAEIERTQKQYEYYRDKLLTFKDINEN